MIEGSKDGKLNRRLRLGMVGGGRGAFIGAVHRMVARIDDRWDFVAGALSSDPERSKASGEDLRLAPDRIYTDYAAMAAGEAARSDTIDAVAIVTPNDSHAPIAEAFLRAGIHVICDKPMTTTRGSAEALETLAAERGLLLAVTHNYTGYPMVRQARAMIAAGEIGPLRLVHVEYAQDWLATRLEETGQKQAAWRTDPAVSGPGGAIGDIGTHAFNLAEFITGAEVESLAAHLQSFVPGRRLDDNANMLLRFGSGASGSLWCSQVAVGQENGLRIRIYGETGALAWCQEEPNALTFTPLGEPPRIIRRNGSGAWPVAQAASRIPAGHPEGYLEGFAQLYADIAELIAARIEAREPAEFAKLVPQARDGVRGVRFIEAAVKSSAANAAWTPV